MRKTLILSVVSLLFLARGFARTEAISHSSLNNPTTVGEPHKMTATFNVRIRLVRTDGTPMTGSHGLRGFWARNEQTGAYYDPTSREGYEFEGLPGGTFTFGAYPGNWEGAVPATVVLDNSQVGPDGFIEVTLVYWVE